MNKLEQKVIKYLHMSGFNFAKGSVSYRGIMKDAEFPDGNKKDMHIIAFQISSEMSDEVQMCYIRADVQTENLEFLITPHFFESITE